MIEILGHLVHYLALESKEWIYEYEKYKNNSYKMNHIKYSLVS